MSFQWFEMIKFAILILLVYAYLTDSQKPSSIQINIFFGDEVCRFSGVFKIYLIGYWPHYKNIKNVILNFVVNRCLHTQISLLP
jgi:hypothetical protein